MLIACVLTIALAEDVVESVTENDAVEQEEIVEEQEPEPEQIREQTRRKLSHGEQSAHTPDLSAHKPDKDAKIKVKTITSDLDGNYQYQFESSNGIASSEAGVAGQVVQGSTTWIAKVDFTEHLFHFIFPFFRNDINLCISI